MESRDRGFRDDYSQNTLQLSNGERGYIYAVDRANTGMHILELTGAGRRIANFPR